MESFNWQRYLTFVITSMFVSFLFAKIGFGASEIDLFFLFSLVFALGIFYAMFFTMREMRAKIDAAIKELQDK